MFVLARAITYATFFVGFILIALPERVINASGVSAPVTAGAWHIAGIIVGGFGAVLATSCILTFVFIGRGTPAPFDPPQRLVNRGPYAILRNPMYLGAAIAMTGAALYYQSLGLAGYVAAFLIVTHLFVIGYEEPTLRRMFGREYEDYCRQTRRWLPRRATT